MCLGAQGRAWLFLNTKFTKILCSMRTTRGARSRDACENRVWNLIRCKWYGVKQSVEQADAISRTCWHTCWMLMRQSVSQSVEHRIQNARCVSIWTAGQLRSDLRLASTKWPAIHRNCHSIKSTFEWSSFNFVLWLSLVNHQVAVCGGHLPALNRRNSQSIFEAAQPSTHAATLQCVSAFFRYPISSFLVIRAAFNAVHSLFLFIFMSRNRSTKNMRFSPNRKRLLCYLYGRRSGDVWPVCWSNSWKI